MVRLLLIGLALLGTAGGKPARFAELSHAAGVAGVSRPGLYRLPVDDELWRHSRASEPLADVRIAGPGDQELPWLVRDEPAALPPQPRAVSVVVAQLPDGSTTITLDLGDDPPPHDRVRVASGPGDFVRPVRVEAAADGQSFRTLADGAIVYRLDGKPAPNQLLVAAHPSDRSRFVRVVMGRGAGAARFTGAEALAAPRIGWRSTGLVVSRTQSDPATRTTRLWLDEKLGLDDEALPIQALTLDVRGTGFLRRAVVSAQLAGAWRPVGSGILYRPEPQRAVGGTQEALRIALAPVRARHFLVEIADGKEPPLRIPRGFGDRRAEELIFRAERAGPHTLYVGGNPLARRPPLLALTDDKIAETKIADAWLAPLELNARFGRVAPQPPPPPPWSSIATWVILFISAAGVVGIAWSYRHRRHAPHARPLAHA